MNKKVTALFKNTRILKFKSQLTFAFFAAVNHLSTPRRKQEFSSTASKGHGLWVVIGRFRSVLCVVFQRFFACGHDYDWRQRIKKGALKLRISRVFESAVKDDPENLEFGCSVYYFLSIQQECIFKKTSDSTGLRVYWSGHLRIYNCNSCCKRWYFTFNGAECSAPAAIDATVYMYRGTGSRINNLYRPRHVEGVCDKIHKGTVPAWDSGSATAQVTVLQMRPRDGALQCPGSTWKKYLPLKFNKSRFRFSS